MRDPDEMKKVDLGKTARVNLPGAGLSGYVWQVQSPASVSVRKAETVAQGTGFGGSSSEIFEVTPGRRGKSVVVFKLRRPWEPRAIRQRRVEVITR